MNNLIIYNSILEKWEELPFYNLVNQNEVLKNGL